MITAIGCLAFLSELQAVYDQVNAMLLNEFLKEHPKVQELGVAYDRTAKTNRIPVGGVAESQRPAGDEQIASGDE